MAAIPLLLLEEDVEGGGKAQSDDGIQNDFAYNNNVHNADIKIRMGKILISTNRLTILQIVRKCIYIIDNDFSILAKSLWSAECTVAHDGCCGYCLCDMRTCQVVCSAEVCVYFSAVYVAIVYNTNTSALVFQ